MNAYISKGSPWTCVAVVILLVAVSATYGYGAGGLGALSVLVAAAGIVSAVSYAAGFLMCGREVALQQSPFYVAASGLMGLFAAGFVSGMWFVVFTRGLPQLGGGGTAPVDATHAAILLAAAAVAAVCAERKLPTPRVGREVRIIGFGLIMMLLTLIVFVLDTLMNNLMGVLASSV